MPDWAKKRGAGMINVSEEWKSSFPWVYFGILVMDRLENSPTHEGIEKLKGSLEEELRSKWAGKDRRDLKAFHPFSAYERYFRRFGQGYPVTHQLESVALKGKPAFSPSALVSCMFMAELKNGILTAGHDLDRCNPPFCLDISQGSETYNVLGGKERRLVAGDMFLSDEKGILSSVLYGPDDRTALSLQTRHVLFFCYGVNDVKATEIQGHLEDIETLVTVLSPSSRRVELAVFPSQTEGKSG